ncbi:MAG: hypothetical protein ACTSUN_01250 [Promethearchaeota archaeon]
MENIKNVEENAFTEEKYSNLFQKLKNIKSNIKNDLIFALLDGAWHSETELVRIAKKKGKRNYLGPVTLGTMLHSLNHDITNAYVEKKIIDEEMHYKISDNYIGLSRAANNKYRFRLK